MAPITLKDPTCLSCVKPNHSLYYIDSNIYRCGDFLKQYESVHRPILAALNDPIHMPSLSNEYGDTTTDGRLRPSLLWNNRNQETQVAESVQVQVSLCTSYDNTFYFRDLPMVLRDHFAIPISPHLETRSRGEHLHTSPEWQRHHTWFIAIIFPSNGKLEGHWRYEDETGLQHQNLGYKIEAAKLVELENACHERWASWAQRCSSDLTSLSRCRWEYEVSASHVSHIP